MSLISCLGCCSLTNSASQIFTDLEKFIPLNLIRQFLTDLIFTYHIGRFVTVGVTATT